MKTLYRLLKDLDKNQFTFLCTVIDGSAFGEKALFSNHTLKWSSRENGFFEKNRTNFEILEKGGLINVDGTSVFCDVAGHEKQLVICGGGHVSIPIIKTGIMMGYEITVLEDRPKFANNARNAGAHKVICESFDKGLDMVQGNNDTFFVIVTRGHRYDQKCLEKISRKQHAYIGMIGSRRRVKQVMENLAKKGTDKNVLDHVHSPIGLDIGAKTPVEIAVAILAEIIQVKNAQNRNSGYSRKLIQAILENGDNDNGRPAKVLTTIVARKGSAPRETGAKILIHSDGTCFGSIGGGCAESDVLKRGIHMIRTNLSEPQICRIDMTGSDAEENGMVCGGVIDILFEVV